MLARASEGRIYLCRFPLRPAVDNGEIFLLNPPPLHGQTEVSRGRGIFRDQDKAACFTIEPVDDRNLSPIDEFKGEQFAEGRPEGRCAVGLARMYEKEGRLVDEEEIFRLGDNAKFRWNPCAISGRR